MARYKTTQELTFLPGPYYGGAEIEFRGWPRVELHLEPLDDEAREIAAYYKTYGKGAMLGELPPTPFDAKGKLDLPPLGPPVWRLGASFRAKEDEAKPEDAILLRAIGHPIGGVYRSSRAAFSWNRWPNGLDLDPMNEQARQVAAVAETFPGQKLTGEPWDTVLHRVNEPQLDAA